MITLMVANITYARVCFGLAGLMITIGLEAVGHENDLLLLRYSGTH